jgi:esterase/lipase
MTGPAHFLPSYVNPSKAITVVVHGLNNKPSVMMELAEFLRANGSDIVLVSLSGHINGSPDSSSVSREIWLNDLYNAYNLAESLVNKSKPVYFLGYSLGALINLDLITQFPTSINYDKMILLAPANATRRRVKILQLLTFFMNSKWKLPSLMPKAYRASPFTPIQAYKVLFEMTASVERQAYSDLHMPVLIIIDPKDEMISLKKLEKIMATYNINKWQLFQIHHKPSGKSTYHHLIIDQHSLGKENWVAITSQIKNFLHLA